MFVNVQEKIAVAGVYDKGTFIPRRFKWHTREYKVEEITLSSDIRDGSVKKRVYSVLCQGDLFRICFNRENESWTLEEVWNEG